VHPTLGILARFQAFFYALAFPQSDGVPPPTPARVTQTVRCFAEKQNQEQIQNQILQKLKFIKLAKVFF
jgi:hypothetical protein